MGDREEARRYLEHSKRLEAKIKELEAENKSLKVIVKSIGKTEKSWDYFADQIGVALCCEDCPGRSTGKVMTVGDIRELNNLENI